MMMIEQRHEFRPPNGDPSRPIKILGLHNYSPSQTRKVTVWQLKVPEEYRDRIPDETECASYGGVCRTLAGCFFDGDETQVKPCMIQIQGLDTFPR
jgi:hypothetical protein